MFLVVALAMVALMPMIALANVTEENWIDCISLKLGESQRGYLASNVKTIAESKFNAHYVLRAISQDGTIVGFLADCREDEDGLDGLYWIFRTGESGRLENLLKDNREGASGSEADK